MRLCPAEACAEPRILTAPTDSSHKSGPRDNLVGGRDGAVNDQHRGLQCRGMRPTWVSEIASTEIAAPLRAWQSRESSFLGQWPNLSNNAGVKPGK